MNTIQTFLDNNPNKLIIIFPFIEKKNYHYVQDNLPKNFNNSTIKQLASEKCEFDEYIFRDIHAIQRKDYLEVFTINDKGIQIDNMFAIVRTINIMDEYTFPILHKYHSIQKRIITKYKYKNISIVIEYDKLTLEFINDKKTTSNDIYECINKIKCLYEQTSKQSI